jgi:hypothetical protein
MPLDTVLRTALDSIENPSRRAEALGLISEWHKEASPVLETVEELVVYGAHERILGKKVTPPKFEPVKKPSDRSLYERIALAWLTWASGHSPTLLLRTLPKASEYGGAIHVMALEPWAQATKALHERNFEEARRFFRRSIELGTQYSTESLKTVEWAYVASFFHEAHRGT